MAAVLSYDPSGNYNEGKGTTGWALFEDRELIKFGRVESKGYDSQEAYWNAVSEIVRLNRHELEAIVIESYKLQAGKAMAQAWSSLETPQLIGHLRMVGFWYGIPVILQDPSDKSRVADGQLVTMKVLEKKGTRHLALGQPTVIHERDAIRHGIFYLRYGKGKLRR